MKTHLNARCRKRRLEEGGTTSRMTAWLPDRCARTSTDSAGTLTITPYSETESAVPLFEDGIALLKSKDGIDVKAECR